MCRRLRGGVICAALAAAGAVGGSQAGASTLIGPPIGPNTMGTLCGASPCTLMNTAPGSGTATLTAPFDGVITAWHVVARDLASGDTVQLRVVRPTFLASSPNVWAITYVRTGTEVAPSTAGFQEASAATRTPISAGEMLAVTGPQGNVGIGAIQPAGGTAAIPATAPDGSSVTTGISSSISDLVDADLEPDADHDGYGDETQDQCPTDAGTQGPCPTTRPASTPTGERAAALKRCKKKHSKAKRRKCQKKAESLPL
jgi:hypothetical protein